MPDAKPAAARMGMSSVVVAVLLVISVVNVTTRQMIRMTIAGCVLPVTEVRAAPISAAEARFREGFGDRQPAREEQEDAPGDVPRGVPIEQMVALAFRRALTVGDQEEDEDREERDGGVMGLGHAEPVAPTSETEGEYAGDPEDRGAGDHDGHEYLGARPRAELVHLDTAAAFDAEGQHKGTGDEHEDRDGDTDLHPTQEVHRAPCRPGVLRGEDAVGCCACERGDAAYRGAVGNGEQQRDGESLARRAFLSNRDRDGQHDERRRGVADPHGTQRGGEHEADDEAFVGTRADEPDHAVGDTQVRPRLLGGPADHEPAHEEQYEFVTVGRGELRMV